MIHRWLVFVLASCLALGCSRGPDEDALVAEVQRRLDSEFEEGLFDVAEFDRRGSAPFHDLEKDRSGVFVFYDARLELLRDYDLASWKGLNIGTLAYVVGATPAGIDGFESTGNRRGDVLSVHGRLGWQQREGEWHAIGGEPVEGTELAAQPAEGVGPASLLETVRELVASRPVGLSGTRDGAIVRELRVAVEEIDLRFARMDGALVLGTGQRSGTYAAFGKAFSRHATSRGVSLHAHPSEGSVDNGMRIQERAFDFALMQSDVAEVLYVGVKEGRIPLPDLRGVASLWPEAVHIVTLEGSGIASVADLRGRRIAMGNVGSGTRLNAVSIGRAAGMVRAEFPEILEVPVAESIAALEAGRADAVFITEAIPSRAIQDLVRRRGDVRFVEMNAPVLKQLSEEHFAYYGLTVPARTYPGQDSPFRVLAVAASLVTHFATPDADVTRLLEILIDEAGDLSQFDYRAGFISSETVRLGMALPLHPSAARFYAEREAAPPPDVP